MTKIIRILTAIIFAAFAVFANIASAQITMTADFNSGDVTQGVFGTSKLPVYPGYSAQIVSDIVREGSGALRVELRSTDPLRALGRRAEINTPSTGAVNNDVEWYALSTYIPTGYINDTRSELFVQWADTSSGFNPVLAIWIRAGKYYLNQKYNSGSGNIEVQTELSNSAVTPGVWDDWVIRYKRAINGTGVVQLWRNGTQVINITGANSNNIGGSMPPSVYFNAGWYKWPWNTDAVYYPNNRVIYIDAIRFGGKDSQLSDFNISGSGTTPTPPPPPTAIPLQGFIFIPG